MFSDSVCTQSSVRKIKYSTQTLVKKIKNSYGKGTHTHSMHVMWPNSQSRHYNGNFFTQNKPFTRTANKKLTKALQCYLSE